MNSREKGKRGERAWRDELRANGYDARRGQQFSGSPDSPDVICDALPWLHFEVKCVERLNIEDAMDQSRRDAQAGPAPTALRAEKIPLVAHKRRHRRWLVTMDAETFFRFVRGDFVQSGIDTSPSIPLPVRGGEGRFHAGTGAQGLTRPTNEFSAAACAAATNQNNKGTQSHHPETNENPS